MLTRDTDGSVGLYDPELLRACHYNYAGLLHPQTQARLEATWRVQQEERRAILSRVWRGDIEVVPRLVRQRPSDTTESNVYLASGAPTLMRIPSVLSDDPEFFLQCRRAQARIEPEPDAPLHDDTAISAWLRARVEQAAALVLSLLADRALGEADKAEEKLTSMNRADAVAMVAMASGEVRRHVDRDWLPESRLPVQPPSYGRRGGPRRNGYRER